MLITMITFRPKSCFSELLNEDNSLLKVINIVESCLSDDCTGYQHSVNRAQS